MPTLRNRLLGLRWNKVARSTGDRFYLWLCFPLSHGEIVLSDFWKTNHETFQGLVVAFNFLMLLEFSSHKRSFNLLMLLNLVGIKELSTFWCSWIYCSMDYYKAKSNYRLNLIIRSQHVKLLSGSSCCLKCWPYQLPYDWLT